MSLRLSDQWVWDCWFAVDGEEIHAFYLQADRSLGEPDRRHWNASIGHAVSRDLRDWTVLPTAFGPSSEPDRPDSYTTWTGSIVRREGLWHLFYTGTNRGENGLIQRVCLATSTDLHHWQKQPGPEIAPLDPHWYEQLDLGRWHDQSWRDPWVMRDTDDGRYHMFVTCRINSGPDDGRGAIGHAVSTDLVDWAVQPPVLAPGWYGEMEVPQVFEIGGRHYLICSVSTHYHSHRRRAEPGVRPRTGTIYFVGESMTGPWHAPDDPFLIGDETGSLYAGRVVQTAALGHSLVAFRNVDDSGAFIGELSDPMPIEALPDGRLRIGSGA
ncbi:MAG: hypothetical protein RQ847_04155 [Wenzhouxiangellaceae bacterium]|nr:hypothetical protein [Wenzhouxiangellaceae bacterium]